MARVYAMMGFGLFITAMVAMMTYLNPGFQAAILTTGWKWPVLLAPLGFVFAMSLGYSSFSTNTLRVLFLTYAAINGLSLSAIINVYKVQDIMTALFSTVGLFGAMSLFGYFTKKDLTSWGGVLFMALIGLLIAMIVNVFVGGTTMALVISCAAVLIFLGLTAYDSQQIREVLWNSGDEAGKATVMGALTLYLDFLNLFLNLLRILGIMNSNSDD